MDLHKYHVAVGLIHILSLNEFTYLNFKPLNGLKHISILILSLWDELLGHHSLELELGLLLS